MNLTRFFKNVKLHFIATINKVKLCKKKEFKRKTQRMEHKSKQDNQTHTHKL
jgi:hypothetical protein